MTPEELRWKGDPYWIDVRKAGEFLGLADKTVLHAGPPIEYERMCLGHQRSMVNACSFEGWAKTEEEAVRMLKSGEVKVEAHLNLREYDFDLDIAVKGLVQVTCDRCLDEMDVAINAEENEWEWDEEPKLIDLSWLAYELIIVNLPLVHSHQDGGCNPEMDALLQDHLCTEVGEDE